MSEANLVYKCPGKMRIPVKKSWYVPNGQTPQQATYCGICISTGCNGIKKETSRLVECVNANCDCPNPQAQHKNWLLELDPVVCDSCKARQFGYATIEVCQGCKIAEIDMSDQLCPYCSSTQRRCYGCGAAETRWQQFQKAYGVKNDLRAKFEAQQLTAADLPQLADSHFSMRNALAFQHGEDSLYWE